MLVVFSLILSFFITRGSAADTLEVVHVIFRHGEKNPELEYTYPTDPYRNASSEIYPPGHLTKVGCSTMYDLGHLLRARYKRFLTKKYVQREVEAWASPIPRCIYSLQLVLASLFQPSEEEVWNKELNWQPTLYHSSAMNEDRLFIKLLTKEYAHEHYKVCESEDVKSKLKKYKSEIKYIEAHSGLTFKCTRDAYVLYLLLESEREANWTLPHWTGKIYPEPLREIALMDYHTQRSTKRLKKLLIGYLLLKILTDTEEKILGKSPKKFHLYAGHDVTVFQTLSVLGFDTMPVHYPDYGACLLLEVHKIEDEYALKVFYRRNKHTSQFKMLVDHQGRDSVPLSKLEGIVKNMFEDNFSWRCVPSYLWILVILLLRVF